MLGLGCCFPHLSKFLAMCLGVGNVTKNGKALLAKVHEICGKEVLLDILKDMESV